MSIRYSLSGVAKRSFVTSAEDYAKGVARGVTLPSKAILCPLAFLTKYVLSQANYEKKFVLGEVYVDAKNDFCFIPVQGIGAPATALQLELALSLGVKKCIFLGTAGSLQEEVQPADIVLCQEAVCADGTSVHYTNGELCRPDKKLVNELVKQLHQHKQNFHFGRNWTTDAIFRETKAEVIHYQKQAVLSVDMEAAAFLAICHQRRAQGAAALVISDTLYKGFWEPTYEYKEINQKLKEVFDCARKTLLQAG